MVDTMIIILWQKCGQSGLAFSRFGCLVTGVITTGVGSKLRSTTLLLAKTFAKQNFPARISSFGILKSVGVLGLFSLSSSHECDMVVD